MTRLPKNKVWLMLSGVMLISGLIFIGTRGTGSEVVTADPLPEGLLVTVLENGSGDPIDNGQVAVVHYTGTLDDGTVFDSSVLKGDPFEFTVGAGRVIKGWDLGVYGMRVGEKRRLVIAPELAYGSVARGSIPANSTLTFEVELLDIIEL